MSETRQVFDSVLDAIHSVGHYTPGVPLKVQANKLGIPDGKYDDYCNPNRKPRFPADLVAPQAIASGNLAVVRTICRDAGGVFVELPKGLGDSREVVAEVGKAIKEAGEVAANIAERLAGDNKLDTIELDRSIEDVDESIAAFAHLRALLLKKKAEAK